MAIAVEMLAREEQGKNRREREAAKERELRAEARALEERNEKREASRRKTIQSVLCVFSVLILWGCFYILGGYTFLPRAVLIAIPMTLLGYNGLLEWIRRGGDSGIGPGVFVLFFLPPVIPLGTAVLLSGWIAEMSATMYSVVATMLCLIYWAFWNILPN